MIILPVTSHIPSIHRNVYVVQVRFVLEVIVDRQNMQKALEHLKAALALLDAEAQHAAAAQLCQLIHELHISMTAASGAS